ELVGSANLDKTGILAPETIQRVHVFRCFMVELVKEIKKQVENRINSSIWNRVKDGFNGTSTELFGKLDEFILEINNDQYLNVTGGFEKQASTESSDRVESTEGLSGSTSVG